MPRDPIAPKAVPVLICVTVTASLLLRSDRPDDMPEGQRYQLPAREVSYGSNMAIRTEAADQLRWE